MEKVFIAADLGGTNLRMAAVDSAGTIVLRNRMSTPSDGKQEDIVSAILTAIDEFKRELSGRFEFAAFGAAMPAIVNSQAGVILRSPNLPELNDLDFEARFTRELGIPVVLENDANSAAVGERWKGAAQGVRNSIHVTLGTGVGGGIIIEGKLVRGIDGTAGEIGHIAGEPEVYACGFGIKGWIEQ